MSIALKLKNFSSSFKPFLSAQSKYIVFTCLFYSLWLTKELILGEDFALHSFKGRMMGISTLNGFDVGARVLLFYKALGTLLCSFFIFNIAGYFISKKNSLLLNSVETKIINYVSLSAILLFSMNMLGYSVSGTMEMVYFIHKLMLLGLLIRLFVFRKNSLTFYNYTFIILISLSLNFLILDWLGSVNKDIYSQFFTIALVISCLLIIYLNLVLRKEGGLKQSRIDEMVYCLLPVAFLPFVTVLKDEIFLIFKARQMHVGSPLTIYIILLLVIAGCILLRRNLYKKKERISQKKLIALKYFPVFIFSIVAYSQYSHFVNFSGEMFEGGNRLLPIMEFKLFSVIPTLEKFNSHVLSDYFFPAIYTLLNGHAGYEMLVYDFLYLSISYVLYYYLIFYISRNAYLALFAVVFFPFCLFMLPEQYSFGIFAFFALQKMFSQKQSLKNYIIFFIALAGMVIWRIDIGVSCIPVMLILLIYYHFISKDFKIKPVLFVKGMLPVVGFLLVLILCFCLYRDANLFKKMPYAFNYLSSAQTWGYSNLGPENLPYKMHYFIFPGIAVTILIALLLNFKALNKSRNQRLAYLGLLFVCVYYLANFNRGLVRHSLIENTDHYASSYIYIVITGAFLVLFKNQKQTLRYAGFFSVAILLLINYKVPTIQQSAQSFFEVATKKVKTKKNINLARIGNRVTDTLHIANTDSSFVKFISTNTKADETFIDFSNTPMLYFYTKKITPSYFYQNPSCSHNDFLQDRFVADLKEYKTPYIVFSRTDFKLFDEVDGVPNTLRHYRIAEHLFQNYKPYVVAGRFRMWKANAVKDNNTTDTVYHFIKNPNPSPPVLSLRTDLRFKPGKKYMAKFFVAQPVNLALKTFFSNDSVTQTPEYVNENMAFCMLEPKEDHCSLELQNIYDQLIECQIIECDYPPDLYYEVPPSNNFSLLPYIWGTFDKKVSQEPLLVNVLATISGSSPVLQRNMVQTFKIPESIDRTSGNTILITCKNNSPSMQKLTLSFGNDKHSNKTKIDFIVIPSNKEETYAIRISSMYKWYSSIVNELYLLAESDGLTVSGIMITKGM